MTSLNPDEELALAIGDVMQRIYATEVKIDWRSQERRPGAGGRKSKFRGTGDDYDGSKPYVPGDNTRFLDWKAYAISGGNDLSIKTFKMTTEVTAYVLVDIAPSMDFGTKRTTKRHLAAELAGSIIRSLDETQDRAGVHIFSHNRLELAQTPRGAKAVVYPAVAAVLGTQRTTAASGSGLAQSISRLPHHRSLIYVISDFMHTTAEDWEALHRVSRAHDLLCVMVQDRRERELPDFNGRGLFGWLSRNLGGFYNLRDWTGEQRIVWVGRRTRAQYAENFRRHEEKIFSQFERMHCRYLVVSTEEGEQARPKIIRAINGYR